MKTILEIKPPTSRSYIFWEHSIKSAVAFVGTFALCFFGPLFLSAKTNKYGSDSENDPGFYLVKLFIDHPEYQIGLSVLAVIIYNIILIVGNSKITNIVSINLEQDQVNFEITNYYFKKVTKVSIPLSELDYEIVSKTMDEANKNTTVYFRNNRTTGVIGRIKPSHPIWSSQLADIRNALAQLKELGVTKNEKTVNRSSVVTAIFRR